jgi:hypothetical protein
MPRVGFEPTIPAFEQASDRAATVMGFIFVQFTATRRFEKEGGEVYGLRFEVLHYVFTEWR